MYVWKTISMADFLKVWDKMNTQYIHFRSQIKIPQIIWKTDPSDIERQYSIRQQQTWFYWVCPWLPMESAINLKPPSTSLSDNTLFWFASEPNIPEGPENEKYQHYINAQGAEVLPTPHRKKTAVLLSK